MLAPSLPSHIVPQRKFKKPMFSFPSLWSHSFYRTTISCLHLSFSLQKDLWLICCCLYGSHPWPLPNHLSLNIPQISQSILEMKVQDSMCFSGCKCSADGWPVDLSFITFSLFFLVSACCIGQCVSSAAFDRPPVLTEILCSCASEENTPGVEKQLFHVSQCKVLSVVLFVSCSVWWGPVTFLHSWLLFLRPGRVCIIYRHNYSFPLSMRSAQDLINTDHFLTWLFLS